MNQQVPILLYHSISEHASRPFKRWTVTPDSFRNQLLLLKINGYSPLTLSEYVECQNRRRFPLKPVLITFDDGFEDFYTYAFPILQEFDFSATLYITTGYVGCTSEWLSNLQEGRRKMLSVSQILELHNNGIEIGAHTVTHPQLDTLSEFTAWHEISESKIWLEAILGSEVKSFAYPHGYYSKRIRQMTLQAGFSSACGVKHAMSHPLDDRYAMARIIIENGLTNSQFKEVLNGIGLNEIENKERLKTKAWRIYRKRMKGLNFERATL